MDRPLTTRRAGVRKKLAENLARVTENIAEAARRVGRLPEEIQLVAVTKSVDLDVVRALLSLGQRHLGESRVQQLIQRAGILHEQESRRVFVDDEPELAQPVWHMIGHLQRNKVKACLPLVEMIHSVDTLRLAEEIDAAGAKLGKRQDVLIQVNCSGEPQKMGMPVAAAEHVIDQVLTLPHLRIRGLMTMAPLVEDAEATRPVFERLYEVFLEIKKACRLGREFQHLSMGMSQDYEVAVECGATMVRVGTALFEGLEQGGE